jgi:hypothetical protein
MLPSDSNRLTTSLPVKRAKRGRPRKSDISPAFVEYQRIRAKYGNLPKKLAAQLAGYSRGTKTLCIEQGNHAAWQSIDKQRDEALRDLRVTFGSQLAPLVGIRDNPKSHDADRIRAAHEVNTMVPGMLAPERRETMSRSIILELSNLSEGDIAALIEHAESSKTMSCDS